MFISSLFKKLASSKYMHKVASVRSLRGSDLVGDSVVEGQDSILPPSCCEELEDEIIVMELHIVYLLESIITK